MVNFKEGANRLKRFAPKQTHNKLPRLKNQSALHQNLTHALMNTLATQRSVRAKMASLPLYKEPTKIGRHEPDFIGEDSTGLIHIGEAKTGDGDLNTTHSREQLADFANRVMTNDNRPVPFHIIVPKNVLPSLRAVLSSLGLANKNTINIWYV